MKKTWIVLALIASGACGPKNEDTKKKEETTEVPVSVSCHNAEMGFCNETASIFRDFEAQIASCQNSGGEFATGTCPANPIAICQSPSSDERIYYYEASLLDPSESCTSIGGTLIHF